ncbi:hypothetical protein Cgig2_005173 [Carnegiea gigantea]|uniref:Uncharacterized protein n=1 Tax=Carnegiea gigantea TaxID=171969 RepID=A0A9Q1KG54_9CARY|nr:hypothetical protein Cgig2_005173 [Carnegiea gigantea]
MGERKVLNKYYPPDFDPAKIFRRKQAKNHYGNYMYKGTKFNCRKEDTDYKNSDYVVEGGATRNFEPWRDQDEGLEREKRKRDVGDAMESLENRTLESKQEMDRIAAIDKLKFLKSRQETVSVEELLEFIRRRGQEKQRAPMAEEDEAIIRSLFHGIKDNVIPNGDEPSNSSAKRSKVSEEPADRESILRSLTVRIVAKRKPVHLAEDKGPEVNAHSKDDQRHGCSSISVLQSLCDYDSEEDKTFSSMGLKGLVTGDIGDLWLSELISLDLSFNRDLTGPVSARLGDLKKLDTL